MPYITSVRTLTQLDNSCRCSLMKSTENQMQRVFFLYFMYLKVYKQMNCSTTNIKLGAQARCKIDEGMKVAELHKVLVCCIHICNKKSWLGHALHCWHCLFMYIICSRKYIRKHMQF